MSERTIPVELAAPGSMGVFGDLRDDMGFLRVVIDTLPECVKVVAPDGTLIQMNAAGLRMIGADTWEQVAGIRIGDLIAEDHRQIWNQQHRRVCEGGHCSWQFDLMTLSGVRRNMQSHAAPILLRDGRTAQLAIMRDITATTAAEGALAFAHDRLEQQIGARTEELELTLARLQKAEQTFALLVDGVTDYAIYMLDPVGRIVSWNAGAARIKGYRSEEVIGTHFSRFYSADDRAAGLPERGLRVAASEGRFEAEGWRMRKDGSRFLANVVIDAIRSDGALIGFAKITRDITERKAAEIRLRQAQKMESVGRFTGGAAHDFNNLLMVVLASLEILRKRLPDDPKIHALLDNAVQGAQRGASLTQRMLAFARRQELKEEVVDVRALVDGLMELLERSVGPTVSILKQFDVQLPHIRTEAAQLETALLNLVLNARDAMPAGGTVTITAQRRHVDTAIFQDIMPGEYVCLCVADTGHGMDESTLMRAAEPFFTTKGIGKGTGLGLSMVDGLVAQSGGKLVVRSEVDRGTNVELWFQLANPDALASSGSLAAAPTRAGATRSLNILVVDDDALVLTNIAAMLEDLGHVVVPAASGQRALEVLGSNPDIEVVISDQAMPGMTGMQLARQIAALHPRLPIILATGYSELPIDIKTVAHRLAKPFTQLELSQALASVWL
jgi:PAS domain S-box-containing protein